MNSCQKYPGKPKRLGKIFSCYDPPLYFVTCCTWNKSKILSSNSVHTTFREYALKNQERGIVVGRYVIMPDHIHMFIRGHKEFSLSVYIRLMKQYITKCLGCGTGADPVWQPGFFDHILRNTESYFEKWNYVRHNPVRAGLVAEPDLWPFQGEMVRIDRV